MLQDEVRDRKNSEAIRDTREASLRDTVDGHKKNFQSELGDHKNDHICTRDEHAVRINYLIHDLGVVVDYLQNIGASSTMLTSAAKTGPCRMATRRGRERLVGEECGWSPLAS